MGYVMAVALEQFVKQLADSGVIAPGKLENFVPPKAQPKDAQELARQLILSKQLTRFQVQEIYQGRAKSLILGNYTILDKIGAGGMGQVFKAEHRRMHRVVAIKMLPQNVTKDTAAIARFQREVEAAAKLEHPNIVAAHDADEAGGVHFLVMQCVEGSDLSALVKKNGPFPFDKAVNYILQAARGLEFAHGEGVVHRDIKPANLLLDKKGTVKILDMGLARINTGDDAATQAELTGTGAVLGTVDYMAPEQALSTKHADARADIYSLGCSLHYLITGKAAYDGDTLMAKLLAHREKPIPSLGPNVSEQVQAVFEKMVAKKVEDRYQAMSEVVADLQECAVATSSAGKPQITSESSSDNANLSFLAEATAHTQHHGQTKQAKRLKKKAKPAKKTSGWNRKQQLLIGGGLVGALILLAGVIFKLQTKDGTLVVEINQPDATVEVLDADGKIEVSQKGDVGRVTISVDPGKHRLRVEKNGFTVYSEKFEIDAGDNKAITAKLEPMERKPTVVNAGQPNEPWNTPAFQAWMKTVAAMPAEQQVEAVSKKLTALNPGFDGKLGSDDNGGGTPRIENGVITELQFWTDKVTDISPVRALPGLKTLIAKGSQNNLNAILADISPLQGMQLTSLNLMGNFKLSDVSPLKGMPLTNLNLFGTRATDITPLKGMPLIGLSLRQIGAGLSDLTLLTGMPLQSLDITNTGVSSLSPLEGMKIKTLLIAATHVSDLSPLREMPLESLEAENTPITDLSPLAGKSLKFLTCNATNVADLSILKGMPLTGLQCDFKPERDAELLHSIKTLEWINHKPVAEFWKDEGARKTAFQQSTKSVAALPAEKQVEAVAKKLQELNPGFDGRVGNWLDMNGPPTIENGVVTGLGFFTDSVTDISPVRALVGLKQLNCRGSNIGKGRLRDLSPLSGMRLTGLICGGTQVSDLSPIEGMPLESLNFGGTLVADLSRLKGMRLACLHCDVTKVSDLSPLKGMPLKELLCNDTQISDLSTLQGMELTTFGFTPKNITKGLDAIRRMKSLDRIGIDYAHWLPPNEFWKKYDAGEFGKPDPTPTTPTAKPITTFNDPAFQQWMKEVAALPAEQQVDAVSRKLVELNPGFDGRLTDPPGTGSPTIKNGVITELRFATDSVTDISPVRVLAGLRVLICGGSLRKKSPLTDLSPLTGMKLHKLSCYYMQVSDLSPLRGMPLTYLNCGNTKVSDLSPLKGVPLTELVFDNTSVSDASSLQGANLALLSFTSRDITKGLNVIREMKSLTFIGTSGSNRWPPAEFWKKYDAGEFGNQQPTP
jgi:serine/threonine protein kinase